MDANWTKTLNEYETGKVIRTATPEEYEQSVAAAEKDGGRGVITVEIDGRPVDCYVED